jgi:microcystin-dependent protein
MATVTGLTAVRMLEIEAASVIDGEVVNGELILTKHDGTQINAGPVMGPAGPVGPQGPAAIGAIPGEVRLWSGSALPELATYGKWVWADGAYYPTATYPAAAAHIGSQWRTFAGASDPGAGNFRVPDLRGLVAAGLDAMPGGSRANRMTRAAAATLAAKTGEEAHGLSVTELARHGHGGSVSVSVSTYVNLGVSGSISGSTDAQGAHQHSYTVTAADNPSGRGLTTTAPQFTNNIAMKPGTGSGTVYGGLYTSIDGSHGHNVGGSFSGSGAGTFGGSGSGSIANEGDGTAHENVQPTVFVPYIVYLG